MLGAGVAGETVVAQKKKNPGGRPALMEGGKRVQVYLDEASLAVAKRCGKGNVSEGIRLALALAADKK